MSKIIYVFCGLDLHKDTMKHCIESFLKVRDDVDIGVSTFGNAELPPSVELAKMCGDMNIPFYDCPRQVFNRMPLQDMVRDPRMRPDVDCCELTGMIQVSTYFYKNYDYEMVILMHPDTLTIRNYNNSIEKYLGEDYCMVGPLMNANPNRPIENFSIFDNMTGGEIQKTGFRISQAVISFGKKYCLHMLDKYKTTEQIWKNVYGKFVKWGDCSTIELYPQHEGYRSYLLYDDIQILSQYCSGEHRVENLDYESFLRKHHKFNFVHIGQPPPNWSCPAGVRGRNLKEKYTYWNMSVASKIRNDKLCGKINEK